MRPVGTMGIHSEHWGWQLNTFGGRRQNPPIATATKSLPLTMGPNGPKTPLPPKHTGYWQPVQMAVRNEGVGSSLGSRSLCSLVPLLLLRDLTGAMICGNPMADRSPELEVSVIQPRCSVTALDLLGVIFPSGCRSG